MLTAKLDTRGLERMLRELRTKDVPKAARNTLRDVMKDTIKREQQEMRKVFSNPTPLVVNGIRITKLPQTNDLTGELGFKDVYGKRGEAVLNAVTPHIPGYKATRGKKGMEAALIRMDLMTENQYLVPSRTMRLNKYGNVTGATASKMLNDLHAFRKVAGYTSETSKAKTKYVWGEVHAKGGGTVKGIWLRSKFYGRRSGALQMLVVDRTPTYAKRFRFHQVARSWAGKRMPYFARKTVEHYITRKYGR